MNMVYSIAVLPTSDKVLLGGVVGGGRQGQLYLVDLTSGQATALPGDFVSVSAVAVSAGGRFALSGYADGSMCLWSLSELKLVDERATDQDRLHTVAFSPDAMHCAVGGNRGVIVYRLQ